MLLFSLSAILDSIKEAFNQFNYFMGAITAVVTFVTWVKIFYRKVKNKFNFKIKLSSLSKSSTKERTYYKQSIDWKDILSYVLIGLLGIVLLIALYTIIYMFSTAVYKAFTEPVSYMQWYQMITLIPLVIYAIIATIVIVVKDYDREKIWVIWILTFLLIAIVFASIINIPHEMPNNEKGAWLMSGFWLFLLILGSTDD